MRAARPKEGKKLAGDLAHTAQFPHSNPLGAQKTKE